MIIPDSCKPCNCLYYLGANVLEIMLEYKQISLETLLYEVENRFGMSFVMLLYALDWLWLVDAVKFNEKGELYYVH